MAATVVPADVAIAQTEVLPKPEENEANSPPVLRLRLNKPKSNKKVGWQEGTVDNEHMGKKKSKCCCIYKKPTVFGESSSEDDEECENCFGHPEKKRRNRKHHGDNGGHDDDHHHHDGDEPCDHHNHQTGD
ncbi:uncharacterized protein ZK945.8 [Musca vetustissima]|uniref:uncharacterized protein ZK945.8 n=1 Tax=Musca vetustissima TaxID=27455 RepID=UPI002AB79311|nr:uncharacterized protein ZK945.8 [Musca vetustissima]